MADKATRAASLAGASAGSSWPRRSRADSDGSTNAHARGVIRVMLVCGEPPAGRGARLWRRRRRLRRRRARASRRRTARRAARRHRRRRRRRSQRDGAHGGGARARTGLSRIWAARQDPDDRARGLLFAIGADEFFGPSEEEAARTRRATPNTPNAADNRARRGAAAAVLAQPRRAPARASSSSSGKVPSADLARGGAETRRAGSRAAARAERTARGHGATGRTSEAAAAWRRRVERRVLREGRALGAEAGELLRSAARRAATGAAAAASKRARPDLHGQRRRQSRSPASRPVGKVAANAAFAVGPTERAKRTCLVRRHLRRHHHARGDEAEIRRRRERRRVVRQADDAPMSLARRRGRARRRLAPHQEPRSGARAAGAEWRPDGRDAKQGAEGAARPPA